MEAPRLQSFPKSQPDNFKYEHLFPGAIQAEICHAREKSVRDKKKRAKMLDKSIFTCVPEMSHLLSFPQIATGFC